MSKNILITESQFHDIHEDLNNDSYRDRWHYERTALKRYLMNFGQIMISRENGKEYKVIFDSFLSNIIGLNYCICIQYNSLTHEAGDIIYVRAYDKFKTI